MKQQWIWLAAALFALSIIAVISLNTVSAHAGVALHAAADTRSQTADGGPQTTSGMNLHAPVAGDIRTTITSTLYLPMLSSGATAPTPEPPTEDPLSAEERMAAVEAIGQLLDESIDTSIPFDERNPVQEVEALGPALLQADHVAAVLVYTETMTIQVVLTDGLSILINKNRPPGAEVEAGGLRAVEFPRAVANNVPGSRRFVSVAYDGGGSVAAAVASLLTGKGYANTGLGATVDNMKNYQNLGALYLDTHGTAWTPVRSIMRLPNGAFKLDYGDASFALQTSTSVTTEALNSTYKADLDAGRLTIQYVEVNGGWRAQLAITERFISAYWNLDGAIVMIHACFGGAGPFTASGQCYGSCGSTQEAVYDPRPIRSAILGAGANVIVSFDNYTNADSGRQSILFFFDRLLGSNEQQPTTPPTRPFQFADVWGEMGRRNLTSFNKPLWVDKFGLFPIGGNQVNLTFDARAGGGSSTALAPSIRTVDVIDDADQSAGRVEIHGSFGEKQGSVEVDGTNIPVTSWIKEKIVAAPPWSGLGSRGYLVVKANDSVRSNFVPFTEWQGTVEVIFEPGEGNLRAEAEMNVRVRADLHPSRTDINGDLKPREKVKSYFTGASTGNSSGSGVFTTEDGSIAYLGGESLSLMGKTQVDLFATGVRSLSETDQSSGSFFGGFIELDAQAKTGRLCMIVSGGYTQRITGDGGTQDLPTFLALISGLGLENSTQGLLSCFNMTMNADYSLAAGNRSVDLEGVTYRVRWSTFSPFIPPTEQTPG